MHILTRRKFLGALLLGGGGLAADMALIEPQALRTTEMDVPLKAGQGKGPLRLLHMSDFHASECVSLKFIERAVRLGLETKPDVICLTGDFISWQWSEWSAYADVLRLLSAAAPTFAVLGNHDGGPWAGSSRNNGYHDATLVRELLRASGVTLLHNMTVPLRVRDWDLLMWVSAISTITKSMRSRRLHVRPIRERRRSCSITIRTRRRWSRTVLGI